MLIFTRGNLAVCTSPGRVMSKLMVPAMASAAMAPVGTLRRSILRHFRTVVVAADGHR